LQDKLYIKNISDQQEITLKDRNGLFLDRGINEGLKDV